MKTFLINLERSQDRLAQATADLEQAGISFERIVAVDGEKLDLSTVQGLDQTKAAALFENPLRMGEVGCYLSHVKAAECIVELDVPFAMVLEDDFALKPFALDIFADLDDYLATQIGHDWDVINLGNKAKKIFRPIHSFTSSPPAVQLCRAFYFPVTTTGLIWSRAGAQRFLQDSSHIYEPVDGTLQRLMCDSGRGLAFRQNPIMANGIESIIDPAHLQKEVMQNASLGYRMQRYLGAMARFVHGPREI